MVMITAVMQMYFNCNPLSDLPENSAWFGLVINTHARSGSGFFTCSLIPPPKEKIHRFCRKGPAAFSVWDSYMSKSRRDSSGVSFNP